MAAMAEMAEVASSEAESSEYLSHPEGKSRMLSSIKSVILMGSLENNSKLIVESER